jgi:hypothetical protein
MIKKIIWLYFFTSCSFAIAQSDNWVEIASSEKEEYYGLKGSGIITKNKSGEAIVIITTKANSKINKSVTLEKLYVRISHCLKKQGKGVVLNMDGEYQYEYDFVFGAGSVGSEKAEVACSIYEKEKREKDKKGV